MQGARTSGDAVFAGDERVYVHIRARDTLHPYVTTHPDRVFRRPGVYDGRGLSHLRSDRQEVEGQKLAAAGPVDGYRAARTLRGADRRWVRLQ